MRQPEIRLADDPKAALLRQGHAVFEGKFGFAPAVAAFAPGRVEILGNHTDYNGGFVMSVAVDRGTVTCAGFSPSPAGDVLVHSEARELTVPIEPATATRHERSAAWANYVKGVLRELEVAARRWNGLRLSVTSDLPLGSGLSSSAALEVSAALAAGASTSNRAAHLGDESERMSLARSCQRAEASFVGVPCGILDQFSSLFGRRDHVLFLDCDTLENEAIPLPRQQVTVVIAGTGVPHALVDGQYADLKASCERAATRLNELLPHRVRFLRDVSVDELEACAGHLEPADRRRAEHVLRENARVQEGRRVAASDVEALGKLMTASHASSRDLLGNSCRELDALVDAGLDSPGCLGGKLCGAGFGGSAVFLVRQGEAEAFRDAVAATYRDRTGHATTPLVAAVGDGARLYELESG